MAEYVLSHNETAEDVRLVVGAAHQPGVAFYLRQFQQGREPPQSLTLF